MIKPILLYSCEVWRTFKPKSSKFRNGMVLDKTYFDLEPDKLHLKISKFILGVNKKSCNFQGGQCTSYIRVFFIENFIAAEIFQPSDKIKLIFISTILTTNLYDKSQTKEPYGLVW